MNIDPRGWSGVLLRTLGNDGTTATRTRGEARTGRRHEAPVSASTDVYQPSAPVVPAIPVARPSSPTANPVSRDADMVTAAPVPRESGPTASPVPRDPVITASPVSRPSVDTSAPALPVPERPAGALVVGYLPSAR